MKFAYFTNSRFDFIYKTLKLIGETDLYNNSENLSEEKIRQFDAIIVKDNLEIVKQCNLYGHNNIIVIPDFVDIEDGKFLDYINKSNIKILCLSHKVYNKLSKYNKRCIYMQYYPEPSGNLNKNIEIKGNVLIDDYNSMNRSLYNYLLRRCADIKTININSKNIGSDALKELNILENKNLNLVEYEVGNDKFKELLEQNDIYIPSNNNKGLDFLEAMNRGVCIVAPNNGFYNEYISNGTNGYLFEGANSYPLEFNNLKELKKRAIESIHDGYDRWNSNYNSLIEFINTPVEKLGEYPLNYIWNKNENSLKKEYEEKTLYPKISVVTVCRNAEKEIEKTIKSVIRQDYCNYEYVILDGSSSDGTIDIIKKYEDNIAYWHSKPDDGIYPTMIDSLEYITGEFVIFMNADDEFVSNDALSRMFRRVPDKVDIVFGHHIYRTEEDGDIIHYANDFSSTWYRLQNGYLDFDWLGGMPCHQTVATKKEVLKKLRFDSNYKIAADHEFYFRAKKNEYTLYNSNELISIYVGGGVSANRAGLCIQEWQNIAIEYGIREAADYFYDNYPGRSIEQKSSKFWLSIRKKLRNIELLKKIKAKLNKFHGEQNLQKVYWDTIEDGFKLFREGIPSFIEEVQGFSNSEGWGRWTIDKKVIIKFKDTLPSKFNLNIIGYAFGKNVDEKIIIRTGKDIQTILMGAEPAKVYSVMMKNEEGSKSIEIIVPYPNSPNELFGDSCNDKRKLGLAISQIDIKKSI